MDSNKLVLVSVDLSKLTDVVKNYVNQKSEYNELVKKVNAIDTNGFVEKTDYNSKISENKGEILSLFA